MEFRRNDDQRGRHRILEANGGGVALFDYDGDGRLDILLTDGCRLPVEPEDRAPTLALFRNSSPGHFEPVTLPAGLTAHGYHHGCAVGDIDGDGFDDLYVTAFGQNSLWQNNGDGTFAEITERTGTGGNAWSSSAAFADLNGDGALDLYVTNYVQYSAADPRLCPDPESPDGYTQCAPTIFEGVVDVLYLADGAGGFRDATVEAGLTGADGKGLGVVVFDADRDGRLDIYVANDGVPNFLYRNLGVSTAAHAGDNSVPIPRFREVGMEHGVALNALARAEASMGIACGDYNADGWPDLYVTNFYSETNTLYENRAGSLFTDSTWSSGAGAPTRPMVGWGTEFFDFDNDTWLDLIVANGHVDDFSWRASAAEPYRMTPQFFRNERNGRFTEVSRWSGSYFLQRWLGRGLAVGDLDNDGDLDLVVSHQRDPSAVLRNDTQTNNESVSLRLVGRGESNRSAVGARVDVEGVGPIQVREIIGGGSYQSSSSRRVHIGLGERTTLPRLRVRWPSGAVDECAEVSSGRYLLIEGCDLLPESDHQQ